MRASLSLIKGMTITVQVGLWGDQFTSAFRAINPDCTVPVRVLDDGATIPDTIANCRYLEELHPDPLSMETATERAVVESWQRRVERNGFCAAMEAFRNSGTGTERPCAARSRCL